MSSGVECPGCAHRLVLWARGDHRRLEASSRWLAEGRHLESLEATIYAAHHFGVPHADVPDPPASYRAWCAASRRSGSGLAPEDVRWAIEDLAPATTPDDAC